MLEQYYRINEATGVSIQLLQNGGMLIYICAVAIKDNQLNIEKKAADLHSIEELNKYYTGKSVHFMPISHIEYLKSPT